MKLKLLASIALLAAVAVPVAGAQVKGKPSSQCARVAVVLKGSVTAAPGAGATQFSMNVTHASHHGKSLVGQSVTIATDSKTKIVRLGKKTDLSSLQANDRVNVLLKVCNKDLPLNPATLAAIPAKRVTATVAGKGFKP